MPLKLTYSQTTSVPVEIEGLTPDAVRSLSLADIERFEIFHGNVKLPLAEMFQVSGDASDGEMDVEGELDGVHWIGSGMTEGEIRIHGNAGRHIGSEMKGGRIDVTGDVGGWVGAEMRGGLIHVRGRAGHLVGAAYRGSPRGMTGGTILVEGDAGNEVGLSMRRGMIAIGGDCGDVPGFNMIAGSIFVFGGCGVRPGAGMRRGTIGIFGSSPVLLPTFKRGAACDLVFLRMAFRQLHDLGFGKVADAEPSGVVLHHGDLLEGGRGEILLREAVG
ncbi:MAG: formylmethanofuran dehydrogenase subunit C [Planctomycetota bacterium]|nr:MAG: formylmethanofuran dehydrogenase subunit C [Planctomycetota bacterium]REK47565.1 MAG: formylmethanofuran dehydrogenase subunit C [Planctomycetota bacterium]